MKPLTETFKPKKTSDVQGQNFAIAKLKEFIINFKKQKKKAAIIYGPPGIGKTSTVYALASELNLELIELNASDCRNSDHIESIIKPALHQRSLFFSSKLIFIDELDGIMGTQDRGGAQSLAALIDGSNYPIIMAANDPWDSKLSTIRKKSNLIEFSNLNYLTITNHLMKLCKDLDIDCSESILKQISVRASGDLRAAINDFHALIEGRKKIKESDIELIGSRDKKDTIFNALKIILKTKSTNEVLNSINNIDMDLDEAFLWIDENIPVEYTGRDITRAYEALSRADVFRGRIIRRQHYRFMVYENSLMTAGVSLAKTRFYQNYTNYVRTTRILKYWLAKTKYQKRKEISKKIGKHTHSSLSKSIKNTFPYLRIIFQKNKGLEIAKSLELEEEEIEYLISR
jgi:replication factor C large subunit